MRITNVVPAIFRVCFSCFRQVAVLSFCCTSNLFLRRSGVLGAAGYLGFTEVAFLSFSHYPYDEARLRLFAMVLLSSMLPRLSDCLGYTSEDMGNCFGLQDFNLFDSLFISELRYCSAVLI